MSAPDAAPDPDAELRRRVAIEVEKFDRLLRETRWIGASQAGELEQLAHLVRKYPERTLDVLRSLGEAKDTT